jgi:hypothetical protein
VHWWLARGTDSEKVRVLLESALEALRSGAAQNLKTGRRKQLYPLDLHRSGSPDHLLKVNDYGLAAGLRRGLRGSKARHELEMAEQVAARGIPTVIPSAAGEQRSGGRLRTCYLLAPILRDTLDLRRLWRGESLPTGERHALVTAFGILSRKIHDAGVFQDDFAPNNFLVRRGVAPQLFMIDFERAQLRTTNDEAARRFMLAKIDRELAGAPVGDRMRFLRAYSSGDGDEARRWWRRVESFAPALAHRDFGRIGRNATRQGRRFRPLASGAWRGFARSDVEDAPLLDALSGAQTTSGSPIRVEAMDEFWRVHYLGLRASAGRRIWVTANFLWARGGLCPRPLGAWSRGDQTVLLLERRAGARQLDRCPDRTRALAATRVLLHRILTLAEVREPLLPEAVLLEQGEGSALRASLVAPEGVHVMGSAGSQRRERVEELVSPLGE